MVTGQRIRIMAVRLRLENCAAGRVLLLYAVRVGCRKDANPMLFCLGAKPGGGA